MPTNDSREANGSHASEVTGLRPNSSTASRANARNSSSVSSFRAAPTIRKRLGIKPACVRWKSPGSSLRRVRSPVAPKRTIT